MSSDPFDHTRRVNFRLPSGGRVGVSVPDHVTNDEARAEVIRVLEHIARGHSRSVHSIDRPRGVWDRVRHAWSYVEMVARIAWRRTFGRKGVERAIADLRAAEVDRKP